MLASEPVSKLSTQMTRLPRASSSSQRWEPRKPAPPVTRQVAIPLARPYPRVPTAIRAQAAPAPVIGASGDGRAGQSRTRGLPYHRSHGDRQSRSGGPGPPDRGPDRRPRRPAPLHGLRDRDQGALRARGPARAARTRRAGRLPIHARGAPRDVPQAALDDAPVRRLRLGEGVQRTLPLPALEGLDRAVDGLRPAHPAGPRLRQPAAAWERSGAPGWRSTRSTTCAPPSTGSRSTRCPPR